MINLNALPPEILQRLHQEAHNQFIECAVQLVAKIESLHFTLRGLMDQNNGIIPGVERGGKILGLMGVAANCIDAAQHVITGHGSRELDNAVKTTVSGLAQAIESEHQRLDELAQQKTELH